MKDCSLSLITRKYISILSITFCEVCVPSGSFICRLAVNILQKKKYLKLPFLAENAGYKHRRPDGQG